MSHEPPFPPPSQDVQEISTPEQFAALAHPLRQRLLFALGARPATVSQLSAQLDTGKGNVAHHLNVLAAAGLIHQATTRAVRGGTEIYYQRTARRILVAEPRPEGTNALLGALAEELRHAPEAHDLRLRHLHLSTAKARLVAETLARVIDEIEEDGEDQPVHGIFAAAYRRR